MRILAIDPGEKTSGVVVYEPDNKSVLFVKGTMSNKEMLNILRHFAFPQCAGLELFDKCDVLAIEDIEGMGLVVGKSTFATCKWIGRFQEAWESRTEKEVSLISRGDEKIILCGGKTFRDPVSKKSRKVTDAMLKAKMRMRFEPIGGGKTPEIGTAKIPGPLFEFRGQKDHAWMALAVAITYYEKMTNEIE